MKPIPLFGTGINAYSPAVSRQRRLNCFYDIRQDGDKYSSILRGTPGSVRFVTLGTSPVRGAHVVQNTLYVVAGAALYSVTSAGVTTNLGALTNKTTHVEMADNGVQLMMVDGSDAYCYTLVTGSYNQSSLNTAGSFGKITADANLPSGATSVAFLDGRMIVERPNTRQYYVSGSYDCTLWTSAAGLPIFGTKENSSDVLSCVSVFNGVIVLWGQQSMEFWQDVGAAPNPFQRINGASQTWGLAAVQSRSALNNSMIFLGQNPQGGYQVMMLNGYTPVPVSNADIEYWLNNFTTVSDATSFTYMVDGHPMYQINFPSANRSFLYDATTKIWQEVQTGIAVQNRHFGNIGIAFNGENYIADSTTGNIYQLRTDAYTDDGTTIKRQVVSRHVNAGGNELSISELWLDVETGVGTQSGAGSNPQIILQVSKDGGRTFGPEKSVSLGQVGQYLSPRVIWRRLGSARDFVFQFTMTDPVKFTVMSGSIGGSQKEGANG